MILSATILPAGGEILNAIFRSDAIGCDIFGKSVYQIFFRRYPGTENLSAKRHVRLISTAQRGPEDPAGPGEKCRGSASGM